MAKLKKSELEKYFQHLIARGRSGVGISVDSHDVVLTYVYDIINKLDTHHAQHFPNNPPQHDPIDFKVHVYRNILLTAIHFVINSKQITYTPDFKEQIETETSLEKLTEAVHAEIDKSADFTFLFWKGVILGYKLLCEEYGISPDIAHTAVISMEFDDEA